MKVLNKLVHHIQVLNKLVHHIQVLNIRMRNEEKCNTQEFN